MSPQSSATNAPADPSTFEACSWVPILQVGGLGNVRVNCFPKAIATWHGRELNPRPPDLEYDALTTLPRCPYRVRADLVQLSSIHHYFPLKFNLLSWSLTPTHSMDKLGA
ncbi:hypothetical protein ElyMa_001234100 [Elysia marginata]|uniref:Uncharacterized protein n=1 Tax=Elysia marginata TaxID=1093978 RepID=A0AAV4IB43_9GAST|nr:hypothetical protein ElyMa_001234100 [Elysia marginata]